MGGFSDSSAIYASSSAGMLKARAMRLALSVVDRSVVMMVPYLGCLLRLFTLVLPFTPSTPSGLSSRGSVCQANQWLS